VSRRAVLLKGKVYSEMSSMSGSSSSFRRVSLYYFPLILTPGFTKCSPDTPSTKTPTDTIRSVNACAFLHYGGRLDILFRRPGRGVDSVIFCCLKAFLSEKKIKLTCRAYITTSTVSLHVAVVIVCSLQLKTGLNR